VPICFIVLLLVIPYAYLVIISFWKYDPVKLFIATFTLENYIRYLTDPFYLGSLAYTLRNAIIITAMALILGYPLAYFLARTKSPRKSVYVFLLIVPLMTGVVVRTFGWMVILGNQGVVTNLARSLLNVNEPFVLLGTTYAVIIGLTDVCTVYMVFPLMSSIEGIDVSIKEAARSLGANAVQIFVRILLPLSLPGIVSGCLLVFTLSAGAIVQPILLGGPTDLTVGRLVYQEALGTFNWPFASAMAFLLFILTFAAITMYLKALPSKRK
jgi:ABC-type spermidine/putrescine transport system permease subunit I